MWKISVFDCGIFLGYFGGWDHLNNSFALSEKGGRVFAESSHCQETISRIREDGYDAGLALI
jgi:hypothetical protein